MKFVEWTEVYVVGWRTIPCIS